MFITTTAWWYRLIHNLAKTRKNTCKNKTFKRTPKRKSSEHINDSAKKISLENITGINANLGMIETAENKSQAVDLNRMN